MPTLRRHADLAMLAVAVAALPWLTNSRTRLPAPAWTGLVVASVVLLALRRAGRPRLLPDGLVAGAVGALSAVAHLGRGVVNGHDTFDHLWGAWAWSQAWRAGDLLPIWLHHLGIGQPQPMFYGPLPFLAMAPFAAARLGTAAMLEGSFVLAGVVAAGCAWLAVAGATRDRRAALLAAVAWSYAPYRLLDSNYRCALGETWALALLPLVLHAFERLLVRRGARRVRRAALATALLLLAHPISLVLLVALVPVLWLAAILPRRAGIRAALAAAARVAGAGAAGVALAGFFALPLMLESRDLDLAPSFRDSAGLLYAQYGVHPAQLVERRLWDDLLWSETPAEEEKAPGREMPFYVGTVLLAALAAALVAPRAAGTAGRRLRSLGVAGGVALLLALAATSHVAARIPLLPVLQFPWRFLAPASAAAVLALGALAAARGRLRPALPLPIAGALALALIVDGLPFTGAVGRVEAWTGLARFAEWQPGLQEARTVPRPWPLRVAGALLPPANGRVDVGMASGVYREYYTRSVRDLVKAGDPAPIGVALREEEGRIVRSPVWPYARVLRRNRPAAALASRRQAGRIEVDAPGRAAMVEVAEQYFPGWQVEIGGVWREVEPSPRGLLAARVPAGQKTVRFRFDRWRADRAAGWLLTAVAVIALLRPRRSGARGRSPA